MTVVRTSFSRVAALFVGIVFAALAIKTWWLELHTEASLARELYALEEAIGVMESPLWATTGILHIVISVSLSLQARPAPRNASAGGTRCSPVTIAAAVSSGIFLLLGIAHIVAVPLVAHFVGSCAADGRTALVAYEILRELLMSGAFAGLGWFLLADSASNHRSGVGPVVANYVGLLAGLLCLAFVFANAIAPLLAGTLMMIAVASWGFIRGLARVADSEVPTRGSKATPDS